MAAWFDREDFAGVGGVAVAFHRVFDQLDAGNLERVLEELKIPLLVFAVRTSGALGKFLDKRDPSWRNRIKTGVIEIENKREGLGWEPLAGILGIPLERMLVVDAYPNDVAAACRAGAQGLLYDPNVYDGNRHEHMLSGGRVIRTFRRFYPQAF